MSDTTPQHETPNRVPPRGGSGTASGLLRAVTIEDYERVLAELSQARAELKLWKPLSPAEAEAALADAQAAPMSEEEIRRIVARVTDPAERLTNAEEAQLHVRLTKAMAERDQARAAAAAMRQALLSLKARIHFVHAPGEPMQFISGKGMVPDWSDAIAKLESALAAGAGRELLAELERLRAENKALLASRDEWKRAGGQTAEARDSLRRRVAELEAALVPFADHALKWRQQGFVVDPQAYDRAAALLAEPAAEGEKEGA